VVILAATVAIFVYGMMAAMLGTILPELSKRYHLTPAQNGTIAFVQALGLVVASLAVGPLLDNEGKRIGISLGLACICLALYLLPRSGGYRTVVFLLFLLGVGGGIVLTGANALVSDVSKSHRGAALNLVNVFFGLGGLATPFISANLLGRNWIRLCYVVGSLALLALMIQGFAHVPTPAGSRRFAFADAGSVLGRPLLFLLGFFMFLYMSCMFGVLNWLPRHLIAQDVPECRALNVLSLGFGLGILAGRVGASQLPRGVSSLNVTLVASIGMAITTFLTLRTRRPSAAGAIVFFAGLFMAPVLPTTLAIVGDAFPRMSSTAIGIVITCGWIGLAVSSRLIGTIAGDDPARLKRALLVIPGFSVIMIGVNLAIRAAAG
jgi:fucose permease